MNVVDEDERALIEYENELREKFARDLEVFVVQIYEKIQADKQRDIQGITDEALIIAEAHRMGLHVEEVERHNARMAKLNASMEEYYAPKLAEARHLSYCSAEGCKNERKGRCCFLAFYCSENCQFKHWPIHMPVCNHEEFYASASNTNSSADANGNNTHGNDKTETVEKDNGETSSNSTDLSKNDITNGYMTPYKDKAEKDNGESSSFMDFSENDIANMTPETDEVKKDNSAATDDNGWDDKTPDKSEKDDDTFSNFMDFSGSDVTNDTPEKDNSAIKDDNTCKDKSPTKPEKVDGESSDDSFIDADDGNADDEDGFYSC